MSSSPLSSPLPSPAWSAQNLTIPRINLTFSLRNLSKADGSLGRPDPMIVVCRIAPNGTEHVIGRTELIKDVDETCDFKSGVELDFFFERTTMLRFVTYHVKKEELITDLTKQTCMGTVDITLGEILASLHGSVRRAILNDKKRQIGESSLIIRAQTKHGDDDKILRVNFNARDLTKKDVLGKSDPFYELYHLQKDGHTTLVYKSEVIKQNLNPNFAPAEVNLMKLVNGDMDRKFLIKMWDWDAGSKNDSLGQVTATVNDLVNNEAFCVELKSDNGKVEGTLICEKAEIANEPTIADYLNGGCKIQFAVAVDFTGSNGDPRKPGTLHYREQGSLNHYQKAIRAFGEVLIPYDSDQKVLALGFGAKRPGSSTVSHCFPLNLDDANPEVVGLRGVEDAYEKTFSRLTLSGPTHFNELITKASEILAAQTQSATEQSYMILLILTDGEIQDMDLTIEALIDACELPLSVVIAGIGEADFSSMVELDGDHGVLKLGKKKSTRDIVQFVPFSKFENDGEKLAQATLYEVPRQFLSFMKAKGLSPIKPSSSDDEKKQ